MNENSTSTRPSPAIRMGEMSVAINDGVLRTLLGSCIGLALYDRKWKVAGLAHIVLPQARGVPELPGKFVDTAIPALMKDMEKLARAPLQLTAKLAGGANMFSTSVRKTIGLLNIEATERFLAELRIPVIASHCGGEQGRRMSLDSNTGSVVVEIVGRDRIEL